EKAAPDFKGGDCKQNVGEACFDANALPGLLFLADTPRNAGRLKPRVSPHGWPPKIIIDLLRVLHKQSFAIAAARRRLVIELSWPLRRRAACRDVCISVMWR